MKKISFILSSILSISLFSQTNVTTAGGSVNNLPIFNGATSIGNSNVYQSGTNVGVGLSSPTYPLQLKYNNTTDQGLRIEQFGSNSSVISLYKFGTGGKDYQLRSTGSGNAEGVGNFIIRDNTAGVNRIFISGGTGNIGINTNNPTANLTVDGNVLIGSPTAVTLPAGYKLYVQTGILTEKVKVALTTNPTAWADYVFDKDYKLRSLEEVESYIAKNKHLPGVPSTQELINDGGIDVCKMEAKLMEKVEELTLYIIELKKELDNLKKANEK